MPLKVGYIFSLTMPVLFTDPCVTYRTTGTILVDSSISAFICCITYPNPLIFYKTGTCCTVARVKQCKIIAGFYQFFPLSRQKYFLPWQKPNPDEVLVHISDGAYAVDSVDVLNLPGVGGDPATAVHDQQDRRGGDDHEPLPVCTRQLPSTLHPQLDLPLLLRGIPRLNRRCCGMCPNRTVLRFLLSVYHKRYTHTSDTTIFMFTVYAFMFQQKAQCQCMRCTQCSRKNSHFVFWS